MAQKKNNNKNENVCGQVQKAHKDKSDKGFYFQDKRQKTGLRTVNPTWSSINPSVQVTLVAFLIAVSRSKNVLYGQLPIISNSYSK